jgi:hypothetical protein
MSKQYTRRQFVSTLAAGSTLAAALPNALAASKEREDCFSFLLLGDTHFDRMEHHDLDWMKKDYPNDIQQVESYCRYTENVLPKLLQAAKQRLSIADPSTAFALHVGDLVEGICGNKQLATQHCREGWSFFEEAKLGVPLVMTKGNHDVTGPGADEAYREVLLQKTAKELGRRKLERTSYSFQQDGNLFAVFDAYDRASIDWLEEVVQKNQFRRLFVLVHMPVVPYNARSSWRVYDHPNLAERRERLINLLGQHRAIVLSGHLHKYSVVVRRCRTGKFVQLAVSSVLKDSITQREPTMNSTDDYGPQLTDLEPDFSLETIDSRKQILIDEKPFINHFEYSHSSGYAMVSVKGGEVRAAIYNSLEPSPWKQLSLTELLV